MRSNAFLRAFFVLAIGCAGCTAPPPPFGPPVELGCVAPIIPAMTSCSKIFSCPNPATTGNLVIHSKLALDAAFSSCSGYNSACAGTVNFNTQMLVGIAWDPLCGATYQWTFCYFIDHIQINYTTFSPMRCNVVLPPSYYWVVLPASNLPVIVN